MNTGKSTKVADICQLVALFLAVILFTVMIIIHLCNEGLYNAPTMVAVFYIVIALVILFSLMLISAAICMIFKPSVGEKLKSILLLLAMIMSLVFSMYLLGIYALSFLGAIFWAIFGGEVAVPLISILFILSFVAAIIQAVAFIVGKFIERKNVRSV